jgi:hypothetical protein
VFNKCAKCGLESDNKEFFLPVRNSHETIFYCPACWEKRSTRLGESYLIACVAILVGGFAWVLMRPQNELAWLTIQSGLFACFVALNAVPHEVGHVLAAFAARAKIFQANIGLGRVLYKRDFWGIEWTFRAIPICGFVVTGIPSRTFYRTRSFLISLGGPLMNCFLTIAAMIVLYGVSLPWLAAMIKSFIVANIFDLVYCLWPRKVNIAGTNTPSDGLTLLTTPFMSKLKIDQEIEAYHTWERQGKEKGY